MTLSNGIPIETVSAMLGHKNFRTTQIYAKVVQEKISKDMKALKESYREFGLTPNYLNFSPIRSIFNSDNIFEKTINVFHEQNLSSH